MPLLPPKRILLPGGILLLGFCLGLLTMYLLVSYQLTGMQSDSAIRQTGKYKAIAPLLLCGVTQPKDFGEYKPLHDTLQRIVDAAEKNGDATDVSVYFRGLSGRWVGIDENTPYTPASLLKVPIMIAYFKEAETNPGILDKEYLYDGTQDLNIGETFKTEFNIKPGIYKVRDLIKAMIVNSDNNATAILSKGLDPNSLAEVYTDLGLAVPDDNAPTAEIISAKGYSYFFRVLYNATYLSPEYSEQAMELLQKSDFPQGLRGGIPAHIPIAQKFGERTVTTPQGAVVERDLHDCGLIYAGKTPYLLCVMTKGTSYAKLSSVIKSISAAVYTQMQAQEN